MLKKRPKEVIPERKDPGDVEPEPCSPGSIEQELDMCETGSLRGDQILHSHGLRSRDAQADEDPEEVDQLMGRFEEDIAEEDREGDEMSGDEHSAGLQGGEQEIEGQINIPTGLPGDQTLKSERAVLNDITNNMTINEESEGILKASKRESPKRESEGRTLKRKKSA